MYKDFYLQSKIINIQQIKENRQKIAKKIVFLN